jgi:hypothetical protein
MFQNAVISLKLCYASFGVAQIPVSEEVFTPEEAALVFSGPQFFVALFAGVLMAFAFQLLLTNFSVAFGISSLGGSSDSDHESESLGGTIRKIETAVGLWTLITVSIALFIACFLAVKLSLVESSHFRRNYCRSNLGGVLFADSVARFDCGRFLNWFCCQHCYFRLSGNYGYSSSSTRR